MSQILTYPYGVRYTSANWGTQIKDGIGGSIPCNNEILRGRTVQNTGGTTWFGSGDGDDNASSIQVSNQHFEQPDKGNGQKGLAFWTQTSTNAYRMACWFDIGAEGGKEDGNNMNGGARSSWLREVTALWFMFNAIDTTEARGCYAQIEKAAIRYRDPNGRVRIKQVTEKLGSYTMTQGHRGGKVMFGYGLSSSDRQTICRNNWRFLGLRIQITLERTGKGTSKDYIQGGITALRLGLGESYGGYNTASKRALVLRGNTVYSDLTNNSTANMLETR